MIYAYVLRYLLLNTWAWILVAVTWHHSVAGALRPIILRLLLNPSHSALGSAAASLVARAPEDWGPLAILWTKEKCLLKVVFFQEKGQTLAYAFTRGWRAMAAMHHAQTPAIRFAPSTSHCVWALLFAPVRTLEVKTDGVQVVPPLLGSEVDVLRILRMGNLSKIKFSQNWIGLGNLAPTPSNLTRTQIRHVSNEPD